MTTVVDGALPTPESTELTFTPPNPIEAMTSRPWVDQIDERVYALFKATKAKDLNDAEIGMALEMARSMGLNPWANEFYAAKGQNGRLLLMVGRDGLLRKAEEFPDYLGYDCDVVRAEDTFERVRPDANGKTLRERAGVVHTYGHPSKRGEIVGAWCVAERRNRPPRFFFAPFDEYRPSSPKPGSSWLNNPSVMIEKVPISVVHRTLCNLSGVYIPEEVEKIREEDARPPREDEVPKIDELLDELEVDAETRTRLRDGIHRLNQLSPGSWGLGKTQMTLPGRSQQELMRQADQIEADVRAEEARQAPPEVIQDAEVVVDADGVVVDEEPGVTVAMASPEEARLILEHSIEELRAVLEHGADLSDADRAAFEAELEQKLEALEATADADPEA